MMMVPETPSDGAVVTYWLIDGYNEGLCQVELVYVASTQLWSVRDRHIDVSTQYGDHWFLATAIGDVIQFNTGCRLDFPGKTFIN